MDLAREVQLTPGRVAFAVVAVAVFVADRVTKGLVAATLAPGQERQVLPHLWLTNTHNSGAAFGTLPAGAGFFLLASAAVAVALAVYVFRTPHPPLMGAVLGLVMGGTLGNGYDRLFHGTVTDFIALHWFPIFNVADSSITVGVGALLLGYLLRPRESA